MATPPVRDVKGDTSIDTPSASRGFITLISGCMFSGKTTELLRRVAKFPPRSALTFKHVIDQRYQAHAVVSHGGQARPAITVAGARDILAHISDGVSTVAIDEAHFFDRSLVETVGGLADRGIDCLLTSLDPDSWGRPFHVAENLRAIADESLILFATCARCGRRADRTTRTTPIVDGNLVGGPESYEPRCQACWRPPPTPDQAGAPAAAPVSQRMSAPAKTGPSLQHSL